MDTVSLPHGGFLEVVFSFDTSSMASCLGELRNTIKDLIQRLQMDIPGIKLAFFVHGGYWDARAIVTKWIDFTCEVAQLCHFIKNVKSTSGGNVPKHYELVLKQVCGNLSWTAGSRRVLVMIGDSLPREPEESCNRAWIDWRSEVTKLAKKGVTIYGVQCGHVPKAKKFYKAISLVTGGKHLRLNDVGSLLDTLMAVCYREGHDTAMLANYEKEVRARCIGSHLAADINAVFANLRNEYVDSASSLMSAKSPVIVSKTHKRTRISKTLELRMPLKAIRKTTVIQKASKSKSDLKKYKISNLPLLKRENVPENNFNLRSLSWSPWKLAMVSSEDLPKDNTDKWGKRVGRPGYRLKMLSSSKSSSTKDNHRPALFEVAVQGSGRHKKRHVVFSAFSSLSLDTKNWEQKLLRVTSQVDSVLNYKGCVYVRCCVLRSQAEVQVVRRDLRRYDYAWGKVGGVTSHPRDVVKAGVVVSKSSS